MIEIFRTYPHNRHVENLNGSLNAHVDEKSYAV